MPKADVNDIQIHYQQSGEGPDIVMVHGITGNLAIWHLEMVPSLMDSYRITTYDLRGHGYSDMPPTGYTTGDHAADLNSLLSELEIERTYLVGHSFGADVALNFTIRHPERVSRLVLVEPAIAALTFLRECEDWVGWKYWREKLSEGDVTIPRDKWYDAEYLVRASVNMPKVFGFRKGKPRRAAPLIRLMNTTTAAKDYVAVGDMTLERVCQVKTPTLLIYGEHSAFLETYEYLRKNLSDCEATIMPGGEHFGPLEDPEFLLQRIRSFLPEKEVV